MQSEMPAVSEGISLKDIVQIIRDSRRLIALSATVGLLISVTYMFLTPKKYEAKWQIQMAQYVVNNATGFSLSNIEEPAVLVQRSRFSSAYPEAVKQNCGLTKDQEEGEFLSGAMEIQPAKAAPNLVELKLRATSVASAKQCAEAIASMIVSQQSGLLEERLMGRREELLQYQQALRDEQRQLETIKKSELGNFGYLAKLDKLSWLRTRIDALQEEAMMSNKHPAKLTAPIFVSNKHVSPHASLVVPLGVLLGFMLGLLLALGRAILR